MLTTILRECFNGQNCLAETIGIGNANFAPLQLLQQGSNPAHHGWVNRADGITLHPFTTAQAATAVPLGDLQINDIGVPVGRFLNVMLVKPVDNNNNYAPAGIVPPIGQFKYSERLWRLQSVITYADNHVTAFTFDHSTNGVKWYRHDNLGRKHMEDPVWEKVVFMSAFCEDPSLHVTASAVANPVALGPVAMLPPIIAGDNARPAALPPLPSPDVAIPHRMVTMRREVWGHLLHKGADDRYRRYVDVALSRCVTVSEAIDAAAAIHEDMATRTRPPRVPQPAHNPPPRALRTRIPDPRVVSWNVGSLNVDRARQIIELVAQHRCHLVCLQEIWGAPQEAVQLLEDAGIRGVWSRRSAAWDRAHRMGRRAMGGTAFLAVSPWRVEALPNDAPLAPIEATKVRVFPPGCTSSAITAASIYVPGKLSPTTCRRRTSRPR